MVAWAPLGKLLFTISILIVNITVSSMVVPFITLAIGLVLMAYSTNFKVPFIIFLALIEAGIILAIGSVMIAITGTGGTVIWEAQILWVHAKVTDLSFNKAWLVLFRGAAGMAVMMSFATSTPIPHFSQAFRQLRVPPEISELIVLIYRYGFLLLERMEVMWKAASCRLGFNGIRRSISTTASIAVGIFISSSEMADKAQMALSCRNYEGYFPVYNRPPDAGIGWVMVSIVFFVAIYAIGMHTADWVDMSSIFFGGV